MTRRDFLNKTVKSVLAFSLGVCAFAGRAAEKFVLAVKTRKYPGKLKQIPVVMEKSEKWSG